MRTCVVSDIHANLHALEAVLEAIDGEGADELWCLGDLVGYGPRPNECTRIVRERADVCLVGNHDLGVLGRLDLDLFAADAAASARWTAAELADDARRFLESLRPEGTRAGVALFHASARDAVWEYVMTEDVAAESLVSSPEALTLVGHSHLALEFSLTGPLVRGSLAPEGTELELDEPDRRLLNPGSVGQPRDGDPRAAYLVLDLDARRATFRRVPYPVERTQAEI
ncbi:MAG TPA: metallophosphoesterase family protein, partial [Gaiellaceae bacterium]|nr:metallophosphoesterase family protein [Gaiellaceae bacterium]